MAKIDSKDEDIAGWIGIIIILCVAIYFISTNYDKDYSDSFYFHEGNIVFAESKCLIGSIFYKDSVILTDNNLELKTQSYFSKNLTTYPYNIIKSVTFDKSFCGYKFIIEYPGRYWGTEQAVLYFRNLDVFKLLISQFKLRNRNRCIIIESY
jgi:hypothetical protein